MPAYKLYCVDEAREVVAVKLIAAEGDKDALDYAKRIASAGISAELWERYRLIGSFFVKRTESFAPR